ncbi:bisphosphoglycerate-dependent phosphoglycerate mutase family 1 [Variovorax sp. Sphag1AA]|nr:bisphosphoglycerate-dependent phosphoglycerate mutase family 1 [Variovorax sp. Sphag1AA]
MSGRLVLLRHGESEWNREQRFTGWADVELTTLGQTQMRHAGRAMRDAGVEVDVAFTSVLRRCVHSLWVTLDEMQRFWIPQRLDWRLNERHYGGLGTPSSRCCP